MTAYTATYGTGDLTEITVDAIAEGGIALLDVMALVVLSLIIGLLVATMVRLSKALGGGR